MGREWVGGGGECIDREREEEGEEVVRVTKNVCKKDVGQPRVRRLDEGRCRRHGRGWSGGEASVRQP